MKRHKTLEEWKDELVGKQFGMLTVLDVQPHIRKSSGKKDGSKAVCICKCGKTHLVVAPKLIRGEYPSCSCCSGRKTKEEWKRELIGKHFGKLFVLDVDDFYTSTGEKRGFCAITKCECGNIIRCSTSDLRRGHVRSCGCYRKEYLKESISIWKEKHPEKLENIINNLRKWHKDNPEHSKKISINNLKKAEQWKQENPEKFKKILDKAHLGSSVWLKNNKDMMREKLKIWRDTHPIEFLESKKKSAISKSSKEEKSVYEFLLSLGYDVERQFYLENHLYDFRIGNFLIEYNGSAYHYSKYESLNNPKSKEPSFPKKESLHVELMNIALKYNFRLIQIWDYQWINDKDFIKKLLKEQLCGIANYHDYIDLDGMLNNDYGFIIEGDFIEPKGIWVSSKFRKVVDSSYRRGKVLIYNSGYTKIFMKKDNEI